MTYANVEMVEPSRRAGGLGPCALGSARVFLYARPGRRDRFNLRQAAQPSLDFARVVELTLNRIR